MAGLYGGSPGRGLTQFTLSRGLRTFPTDLGDPLYALRRYLCTRPTKVVGLPPSPPPFMGIFEPLIISEDLIISEGWEDMPTPFTPVIIEPWEYPPPPYVPTLEYDEDWSVTITIFPYVGSGGLSLGGTAGTLGPGFHYIGSGGLVIGGTSGIVTTQDYVANGGLILGGTGGTVGPNNIYLYTGTGGLNTGGAAGTQGPGGAEGSVFTEDGDGYLVYLGAIFAIEDMMSGYIDLQSPTVTTCNIGVGYSEST